MIFSDRSCIYSFMYYVLNSHTYSISRTLSQSMMVYLHLGYNVYKQLLQCLPKSEVQWLPETIQILNELLHPDSQLREKETVKKLLNTNDFPVMKSEQNNKKDSSDIIGEIVERPIEPQKNTKSISKKFWSRLNSVLSEIKDFEDMKAFIKAETDQRHKCRKEALTKKLEQAQWKELKIQIKTKLNENTALSSLKLFLYCYILCPLDKGRKSEEVKSIESRFE